MNGKSRARISVLLLASMALIAAGCGGDDDGNEGDDSATPTESAEAPAEAPEKPAEPVAPTKKEYIAEADKLCKQITDPKILGTINDALTELGSATTTEAQSELARQAADGLLKLAEFRDDVTKKLEKIETADDGGPKDFLKSRERNTQGVRDWAKALETYAKQLSQESADAASAAGTKSNELSAESEKVAGRYGFKECGQRSSSSKK